MAEAPASPPLDRISLPTWPTCHDCLAWSNEHLAVAGGEVVHILTPSDLLDASTSTVGYWHSESVKVNQFTEAEWPYQELATLPEFSMGEEQSDSTVTSLSWSGAGLGIHRRSTLAVLTSNLVLSLWESNGLAGTWRRTSVINQILTIGGSESPEPRRQKRIRAFSWLPPLHIESGAKRWGTFHITVVDDDDTVYVIKIDKEDTSSFGTWTMSVVLRQKLSKQAAPPSPGGLQRSSLQSILQNGPLTRIEVEDWSEQPASRKNPNIEVSLKFHTFRGPLTGLISAQSCTLATQLHRENSLSTRTVSGWTMNETGTSRASDIQHGALAAMFQSAIMKPASDFDKHFNLSGRHRVQFWGSTSSPAGMTVAACITFHPSDRIEYTTPSTERCSIVFAASGASLTARPDLPDKNAIQEILLRYVVSNAGENNILSERDKRIVLVASRCIRVGFQQNAELMELCRRAEHLVIAVNRHVNNDDPIRTSASNSGSASSALAEPCEICGTEISPSSDLLTGRCASGHRFIKCCISFLSIQEPGVSKYCSRCGKQFLALSKLESQVGPSLSQSLFQECDACPYCQGKFRG